MAGSEAIDDVVDAGEDEGEVDDEASDVAPDVDDVDVAPDDDVPPSDGSADATPAVFAIAAPTPNATANAPTRPMWRA